MSDKPIRVGIIGVGFWVQYGVIPALRASSRFEVVAVASRGESANRCASELGIPMVFSSPQELIDHPDVDLVAVVTGAPARAALVKAVIAAGKDVYGEWPLSTTTADSEELLALATAAGVRHVVGLQRRLGPSARYVRDLIDQGYLGQLRSALLSVGTDFFFPARIPTKYNWIMEPSAFQNALSVYGGHHTDTLFSIVGRPKALSAMVEAQRPFVTLEETGERVPNVNPDAVAVSGALKTGGLFSVQVQGGQPRPTGLLIEITGTEGLLRISNERAFENAEDNMVVGVTGEDKEPAVLAVPAEYRTIASDTLDASVLDVAYLFDAFAQDAASGDKTAPDFGDALAQHHLIDNILRSSGRGTRQDL